MKRVDYKRSCVDSDSDQETTDAGVRETGGKGGRASKMTSQRLTGLDLSRESSSSQTGAESNDEAVDLETLQQQAEDRNYQQIDEQEQLEKEDEEGDVEEDPFMTFVQEQNRHKSLVGSSSLAIKPMDRQTRQRMEIKVINSLRLHMNTMINQAVRRLREDGKIIHSENAYDYTFDEINNIQKNSYRTRLNRTKLMGLKSKNVKEAKELNERLCRTYKPKDLEKYGWKANTPGDYRYWCCICSMDQRDTHTNLPIVGFRMAPAETLKHIETFHVVTDRTVRCPERLATGAKCGKVFRVESKYKSHLIIEHKLNLADATDKSKNGWWNPDCELDYPDSKDEETNEDEEDVDIVTSNVPHGGGISCKDSDGPGGAGTLVGLLAKNSHRGEPPSVKIK